eukprot:Phypoly_transcript_22492.p1 GENE.Phypoly_transcript_22492~~Phypoly_transcript_22492.p1  ORF type:complete len:192 (+),score=30.97 Phypoly_transcript_22492:68-577(+)
MKHTFSKKDKQGKTHVKLNETKDANNAKQDGKNDHSQNENNNAHPNDENNNNENNNQTNDKNNDYTIDLFHQKLPFLLLKEIYMLLAPKDVCQLSGVNHAFHKTANDNGLWQDITSREDKQYDSHADGDPKRHFVSMCAVWYNDFQTEPIPPPKSYIPYGATGWNPDLY